jgi:hypothetical protein
MTKFAQSLGGTVLLSLALFASHGYTQQSSGCGPASYSFEHQRYTSVPCAPPTPQAKSGTAPCGPVAYSFAEQNYSAVPCPHPSPVADKTAPSVAAP